ncbi:MAG: hypothetical protein JST02_07625 [Bacteroidetes bacterium]|nr:hypothetical protein [Bacteroidota bacterium]
MKRFLFIIALLIGSVSLAHAQDDEPDPGKREQKIRALYVAYITQQLSLTEDEAQRFWPVHKQFDDEIKTVDPGKPELERQQLILDIKKKYQDRFVRILGNNRADVFFRKDTEFRKKLVDTMRNRRQQGNLPQRPLRRN